jgi:surface protein
MSWLFNGCSELTTIYVGSEWSTDGVTNSEEMFAGCTKLVGGKDTAFDADHIDKTYAHIDGGASNPGYLTDKNAPAEPEHYAVLADNDIVINPEGAALPGKTLTFFYDTKKAERSGMSVGPFDLPQNREWESLLQNITTVQFDESMANDTTVTSTAYWFYGCQNLEYVYGTENLKTQNVTDMKYMFYDCNVLQEVNLSGFNTANVADMTGMFYKCHSLQTIDLTNFNTSKVTNMSWMFYNCSAVTKIYAGSYWTTTAVRESEDMFVNCTHVVGSAGTTYDANHVDAAYAHIDGGPSNPGYLSDKNAPVVPDPEPYVVLDGTTMTFYYDTEMNSRQGMPIVAGGATVTWGNYAGGITNVVFTSSFAEYLPVSTASWFSGFKSLTTITGIENLKTDSVKSMRSMFQGCASLIHVDMSQFNTSKVEDFGNIFNGCSSLAAIQAGYAMIPAEEYARVDNPNLLLYVNEPSLAPQSVQNVVVRDFAKTIILTDEVGTSGNNNFYAPKSFTAEMISYTHEYRQQTVNGISRGWESIVLPFTVQTIVNERNGVIAPFGNAASELHFWLRQLISDGIVRATQIEANKAYIISMPNNEEEYPAKYNQNGRVTFSSENALVPATVIEGVEGKIASGEIVTLMPNFQKKYANENFYALNVGEERLYNGTSYPEGSVFERGYRAVRPFEAYTIHHGSSPAPQFISIADITNGDNLTGIDAILVNSEKVNSEKWYDLNGQQLQKKPTRKGVYILNGRKVVVE